MLLLSGHWRAEDVAEDPTTARRRRTSELEDRLAQAEKDEWVRAINAEVKQLRSMANTLSSQLLQLPGMSTAS